MKYIVLLAFDKRFIVFLYPNSHNLIQEVIYPSIL